MKYNIVTVPSHRFGVGRVYSSILKHRSPQNVHTDIYYIFLIVLSFPYIFLSSILGSKQFLKRSLRIFLPLLLQQLHHPVVISRHRCNNKKVPIRYVRCLSLRSCFDMCRWCYCKQRHPSRRFLFMLSKHLQHI